MVLGMTTATDLAPAAADRTALQVAGADLLQALLIELSHAGYRKAAVDTWHNDSIDHNIRHSYRNGEWTLTCWHGGGGALEVRYSVRAEMPTVRELFNSTAAAPF